MQPIVLAATHHEISSFQQSHPEVPVYITGAGTMSVLYALGKIPVKENTIFIQAGIGGSFDETILPGEVVVIEQDAFAISGVWENEQLYSLEEKGIDKLAQTDASGWLKNESSLLHQLPFKKVRAVTSDLITDHAGLIASIRKRYQPQVESMEGAALHYYCMQKGVSFLQIRSISNEVGVRNKTQWKMKEAIENLTHALEVVIDKIKEDAE
jgi:futalosine hydrolase